MSDYQIKSPRDRSIFNVLVSDMRFWLLLFFVLRLYGITHPPLEVAHNWRQTTVTMAARNFIETDNNIFYPRIDIAGEKSGITGMEFPLLNYLIYLVSLVFGYTHWYGRLINLVISSFGIWFFYRILKIFFSRKTALYAGLVLLFSIWFAYSRKIMPDTFATSLVLIGVFYGLKYFYRRNKTKYLILYLLFGMAGVLSKLPAAILLSVFVFPLFSKSIPSARKYIFTGISALMMIPVFWWYFLWVPYLNNAFGFQHFFMGEPWLKGLQEIGQNIPMSLKKFYENALKFIGFAVFLLGIIQAVRKKERKVLYPLLAGFIVFLAFIFKAGDNFYRHSYYMIPFVPFMAMAAGYGLGNLKVKYLPVILMLGIGIEGIANQQHDFRIKPAEKAMLNLEKDLDSISKRRELLIINSGEVPTPMYFAHRKGWVAYNEQIRDSLFLKDKISKGADYLIILKKTFGTDMEVDYPLLMENEDYEVYDLKVSRR